MRFVKSAMAALLGTTLLAGCGGGGGGGSTPAPVNPGGTTPGTGGTVPAAPDGTWLRLTPGSVALKSYPGETTRFTIKATSGRTFDKPFNVAVIDSQGVVSPQISISKQTDLEYIVGLQTAARAAGTHTTRLEVRLCEDDPVVCAKPLPGSPWYVPLTVDVATAAQAQERMTMMPAAIDLVTYEGEPRSFPLEVKANAAFDVPIRVGVFDSTGVIAPDVTISQSGPGQYAARMSTASTLARGEHTASLEVRVCYDDPRNCTSPVSGSPWRVPLKVTVKAGTNLTPLAVIPALAPWSSYNGNAAQNAYVPARFEPAVFTRRWSKPESELGTISAPAVDNGKVFAIRGSMFSNQQLVAIDEASGAVLWRHEMGAAGKVNPPAAADGKVFVTSTLPMIMLQVFDQASGGLLHTKTMSIMSECRPGPTVAAGMVYSAFDRLSRFNPVTNTLEWRNASAADSDPCSPSVEGSLAYGYTPDQVYALNTADGSIAYTIADQGGRTQGAKSAPLVLADGMGFVTAGTRLLGFDLRSRTRAWVAEGKPVGQPAVANGIVYSLAEDGTALEARAAATGLLQWKSASLTNWSFGTPYARMAVTSNLVFASSATATVALDLATHQVVWSYPLGGDLAISDRGVLYIFGPTGKQAAINLR